MEFSGADSVGAALASIVTNFPPEWRGTTFKNSALLGREKFASNLADLIASKGSGITSQDLEELGNAEDYLRVSSNVSCVLEYALGLRYGLPIAQVFTFASTRMPFVAVFLTAPGAVHLHLSPGEVSPFTHEQRTILSKLGVDLSIHHGIPTESVEGYVNITTIDTPDAFQSPHVDGVITSSVLYIRNAAKIVPSKVLVIRKRMATPMTTPAAEARLQALAGLPITADKAEASVYSKSDFYAHLQLLSGADPNPDANPVVFSAGLSALCSLWVSLIHSGGADIVMASTAYGGSSELTDIMTRRSAIFRKHTFDVTGRNDISAAIRGALDALVENKHELLPTTVLFVEIPTNPDMKVPDTTDLVDMLGAYRASTGKEVLLLVDTTFAPGSRVLHKVNTVDPTLTAMVFVSMSKSLSRGYTTAGAIIAGNTAASRALIHQVAATASLFDTTARRDQMLILTINHVGVEERCQKAYEVAVTVGNALREAVRLHCNGYDMPLAFVTPAQATIGFTSMTFSFNLPPVAEDSDELNAGLAQRFVDLLTQHREFKPCVSFGQDNGLVYATVPATSTQGAISAAAKAKQAVGGVQLTRLSFPPDCDVKGLIKIITDSVITCYRV
jgi:cystathionine beta-lyase/cystathionine gamma-synthase